MIWKPLPNGGAFFYWAVKYSLTTELLKVCNRTNDVRKRTDG